MNNVYTPWVEGCRMLIVEDEWPSDLQVRVLSPQLDSFISIHRESNRFSGYHLWKRMVQLQSCTVSGRYSKNGGTKVVRCCLCKNCKNMLFREKKCCISATKLLHFLSFLIIKILGICISVILTFFFFFDVLLTVHLSIILAINQLNAQNLLL